ncbi:hypothetical protein CPB83DRAFT_847649 [Crepidotus variabilis]|uniref:Uncharacterized protein n=1 Tax=Crepidotus variabilis TaxID=179855 RepID=A0A9P6JTV8_9AGAR|nr:hypothetical protein CPB83DRAFT_847649 [Crepidotus variabilis]
MSNDRPIVIAPRPVRLASSLFARRQDATDFSFIADIRRDSTSPDSAPDRHSARPPSSSALPSEALDEFLSILRPSFMRKPRPVPFPAFLNPDRPLALRSFPRVESSPDPSCAVNNSSPVNVPDDHLLTPSPSQTDDIKFVQPDISDARQWFSSTLLSSPISRFHTRNPFPRQVEDSPAPMTPLSPASIPLPAPSPGEMMLENN